MKQLVFSLIIITWIASCKKNDSVLYEKETSNRVRYPETTEEKQIVAQIAEISEILKEVCKNKEANKEIAAVIKGGFYDDERVLIKDLMNHETSMAYQTEQIKNYTFKKGAFKSEYNKHIPSLDNNITSSSSNDFFGDL